MSIEDAKVIDAVSTDTSRNIVLLTATDHLKWGDMEHLLKIQEKMNAYLSFIESGEIYESYPSAKGMELGIEVICKYPPDEQGVWFLGKCLEVAKSAGVQFEYNVS